MGVAEEYIVFRSSLVYLVVYCSFDQKLVQGLICFLWSFVQQGLALGAYHFPWKCGRRFSLKACTPSWKSSVVRKKPYILPSIARPALKGTSIDAWSACFPAR